jgi:opacity protein-like surface antigen
MKKLLAVSAIAALGFSAISQAGGLPDEMAMAPMAYGSSDQGIYIGIQGGWGITNWKFEEFDIGPLTGKVSSDNGAVGRAFLGFDLCKYFAIEAGYTYFFNNPKMKLSGVQMQQVKRTHAIDLMGKIKAPVADEFNLYAKIGANYLMTKMDKDNNDVSGLGDKNRDNINVAFGAGADYYITPNVIANIEWLRFNGKGKHMDNKYQPYTDAFMVGLRYKFDI